MPLFSALFARRGCIVTGAVLPLALFCLTPMRAQEPIVAGTMPEDQLPELNVLIESALRQSPTMVTQEIAIAQAQAGLLQADSSFWPQINGGVGYTRGREKVTTNNGVPTPNDFDYSGSINYNLGISQNLFQWGALVDRAKVARIGLMMSQKQYAEGYRSLVLQIRAQFLALISAKSQLRTSEFNLKLLKDTLAVAEEKLRSGIIPAAFMAGPQLDVDDQQLAFDREQEAYVHAKRILAQMAGVEEIDEAGIPMEMPNPIYSKPAAGEVLASVLRDGAKSTFQAQVYIMTIRQNDLNYWIAETNLLPHFSASAGVSESSVQSITPNTIGGVTVENVLGESYSVSAGWTLFDGFSTRAQKREALASRRSAEQNLETYTETTLEDAQDMESQLEFSARALKTAEFRHQIADGSYHQAVGEFKLGNVPQTAVDNSKYTLYTNETAVTLARADVFSHWCALVSLAGMDPALNNLPPRYVRPVNW
jgi:outer membrane protein TolC